MPAIVLGLPSIEVHRDRVLDDLRGNRLRTQAVRLLQGEGQVVLDLQRRDQPLGQQREGLRGQDVIEMGLCRNAQVEQPGEIGRLLTALNQRSCHQVQLQPKTSSMPSRAAMSKGKMPYGLMWP